MTPWPCGIPGGRQRLQLLLERDPRKDRARVRARSAVRAGFGTGQWLGPVLDGLRLGRGTFFHVLCCP